MVQQLGYLAAPAEDLDLVPNTHMATQNCLTTPILGDPRPPSGLRWHQASM